MRYKHSGSLGDIIYSLPVVKKMGPGDFLIPVGNLSKVCYDYGYNVSLMHKQHHGCMTVNDINMLMPLLESQPYINSVNICEPDDEDLVNLDKFRGVLFRSFNGNYVEGYMRTFNLPFTYNDSADPWMEVEEKLQAPYVVCRTPRYITDDHQSRYRHRELANKYDLSRNGIFVGTEEEHYNYQTATGISIHHYKVKNFLELAQVIAGCIRFIGNQTFAFSLAMALGKPAILEHIKTKPLKLNECYFENHDVEYI